MLENQGVSKIEPAILNKQRLRVADELSSLGAFDWAMPQVWATACQNATGVNPSGQVVWFYPKDKDSYGHLGGRPWGLTDLGWYLIHRTEDTSDRAGL
jgi:hypothetical protein